MLGRGRRDRHARARTEQAPRRVVEARGRRGRRRGVDVVNLGRRVALGLRRRAVGAALHELDLTFQARHVAAQRVEQLVARLRAIGRRRQRQLARGESGRDRRRIARVQPLLDGRELVERVQRALERLLERFVLARAERDGRHDDERREAEVREVVELEHQMRPR
jgi:hypothetical protein